MSRSAWFDPAARFVVVVTKHSVEPFADDSGTFFIVGSDDFDSSDRFLQVASWDGHTFRFYGRGPPQRNNQSAWIYQGSSWDAFDPQKAYLGPFNGHINGAVVMKELQNPWIHWQSSAGSVADCLSPAQRQHFKSKPYLSNNNLPLGNIKSADHLETIVRRGVSAWNAQRKKHDFKNEDGTLKLSPANIPRWMAHLLLTTTVNIHCGERGQLGGQDIVTLPPSHFFNKDVLKACQPANDIYSNDFDDLSISSEHYDSACERLGLSRLKEITSFDNVPQELQVTLDQVLLGGQQHGNTGPTSFAVCLRDEGRHPFTILAPSLEDSEGILTFQSFTKKVSFLSSKLFNCLMMIDYWNPIYSWRRGVLMQYMPSSTTLDTDAKTYSVEDDFIKALRRSPHATQGDDSEKVEKQFLELYDNYNLTTLGERVSKYAENVKTTLQKADGVFNYMLLAESRRRIYRPLPLNEFGLTLPFALKYPTRDSLPLKEMTEAGTVVDMPQRGTRFLTLWTGTLWSDDPELLPLAQAYMHEERPPESLDPVSPLALPQRERTRRAQ
ncbi:hypothetical protein BJX66DRAFT_315515 [Aspergillus keveii]|uniref:Uncharacterized protein n=1 Tax=Aspergillus keveii TaxID=714993 RepID=A0ABR4FPC3_9EURO